MSPVERAEREELLERYDEIAQLAGGLAHEIRNPLSAIAMNLSLLVEELDDSSPRERRMRQRVLSVQEQCGSLEEVLDAFLQFVRLGELEVEPTDLNAVVQDFVAFHRPAAEDHGLDVSLHLASDLPPVALDTALFRQVLENLARNARQAMPEGGPLELQTRLDADRVVLDVIDGGRGIPEATRERMFEAFFSTSPGGSGLGLPTVRRIVEAHGGSITCESEVGQGTRFTVSLPPADLR